MSKPLKRVRSLGPECAEKEGQEYYGYPGGRRGRNMWEFPQDHKLFSDTSDNHTL
jgi:hypothetical protein